MDDQRDTRPATIPSESSQSHARHRSLGFRHARWWSVGLSLMAMLFPSCASLSINTARRAAYVVSWPSRNNVGTRAVKRTNKLGPVKRLFAKPPKPSERTEQVLRQQALIGEYESNTDSAISELQTLAQQSPTLEKYHAVAELAFQQGDWAWRLGKQERAITMFSTALVNAHQFLFDPNLDVTRNAYDPQFRSISDIYNQSLEAVLRLLAKHEQLAPGNQLEINSLDRKIKFSIVIPGRWKNQGIERFEFTSDFEPQGINNQYQTFGLGVPLIGVRRQGTDSPAMEEHYPPGLTMAFTAFLDINDRLPTTGNPQDAEATLFLFDPLEQNVIHRGDRFVPLESDITTPMAYYLDDPLLHTSIFATFALLNADFAKQYQGIYMLEPYDPDKIPVVMVHGLWSSPITWLQLFNDLRADREIREHYQFWFCLYPTGQPFWESARQVRNDLEQLQSELAAQHPDRPPQEMVLVGHSMGGLISRMLTIYSRESLWSSISDHPIESFEGDPKTLARIRSTFHFEPVAGIHRVITLGTPHRGSDFSSETTQWLSEKLFTLPQVVANDYQTIAKQNRDLLKNEKPLLVATSIDSLSPKNPIFAPLLTAEASPNVIYHNIYGHLSKLPVISRLNGSPPGDGVVAEESARVNYAISELAIDEEHTLLHQHPRAILEVKRILLEDLAERNRETHADTAIQPVGALMATPIYQPLTPIQR